MSVTTNYQFQIPADHPSLAGHFPGDPVVPGVVLLDEILLIIEKQFDVGTTFQERAVIRITGAKFLQPVLPEQLVQLEISSKSDRIDFQGRVSGVTVVSGSGRFAQDADK